MKRITISFFLIILLSIIKTFSSTEIDFFFTTTDNVQLDCTEFIPDDGPPQGGYPAVIICHGFGLDKYDVIDWAQSYADDEDFYSLCYTMRGQGISTGKSNIISTTEMNDLMQIIQYVKNHSNVNPNKIGLLGGSQGGIIPFMAICNGANVKCACPELSSPEFASSWIENGCIKMTLLWSVSYDSSIVRYNSTTGQFRSWILSSARDKWDSLAYYVPLNRNFTNKLNQCQVPIFTANAWMDKFFNTAGIIHAISNLPSNLTYRMYFGSMDGHGSDTSYDEFDYESQVITDWVDYWCAEIQNGVTNPSQKFSYACTEFPITPEGWWTFQRFYSPVWPPGGVTTVRLYLNPDSTLSPWGYAGSTTYIPFLNNVINPNLTMLTAVNYEFTGPQFSSQFGKTQIIFDSPTLLQNAQMAGIPDVNLTYSSDTNLCQFNFQIWDCQPNGTKKIVTSIDYTDRNYTKNTIIQKVIYGTAHGHVFFAGDKIRVILTNLDNITNDLFLRTNPVSLPVLTRANNKVYCNNSNRSFIELPMIGFAIGINKISNEVPQNFKLGQNYPNPFNPSTKIKFEIPSLPSEKGAGLPAEASAQAGGTHVRLIVYDILGHEIATLVNEKLYPGTYEASFDGLKYPSGIYFYRLQTPNYSDTKRMVLLK